MELIPRIRKRLNTCVNNIYSIIAKFSNVFLLFVFILLCSLNVYWIVNSIRIFKYIFTIFFILSGVSSFFCLLKFKISGKTFRLAILWLLSLAVFFILFKFRKYNPFISNDNIKLLSLFLLDIIIISPFYKPISESSKVITLDKKIIFVIFFTTFFFLFFYQPFIYYLSSPSDIGIPFKSVLTIFVCAFIILFSISVLLFSLLPLESKYLLVRLILVILMSSFIFSMILKINTGLLDVVKFQNEQAIFEIPLIIYLRDPLIITGLWILSGYSVIKKINIVRNICIIFTFVLLFDTTMKLIKTDKEFFAIGNNSYTELLPASTYENHQFSKEGNNIIFVIADMFNGNYFSRILKEDEKYKEMFSGFSYYPDCLAISSFTTASLPGIFAGHDYIPVKLNNNGKTGLEEIRKAAQLFFLNVNNYDITAANPLYITAAELGQGSKIEYFKNYMNYWEKNNGYESKKDSNELPILFMLSIFNSAPYHLKYIIYDKSDWIILRKSALLNSIRNRAIENLAYIDLLPEISSANGQKNKFFYMHNNLTHAPYGIDSEGNPVRDKFLNNDSSSVNSSIAAYYSAKKFIDVMGNWFKWMKENNVYDNTAIIILSDHGNSFNDNDVKLPSQLDNPRIIDGVSRSHALLLVKGFGKNGDLKIEPAILSSADIPAILKAETDIYFPPEEDPRKMSGVRKLIYSESSNWNLFAGKDTIKYKSYQTEGSIFDPASWSIYKD